MKHSIDNKVDHSCIDHTVTLSTNTYQFIHNVSRVTDLSHSGFDITTEKLGPARLTRSSFIFPVSRLTQLDISSKPVLSMQCHARLNSINIFVINTCVVQENMTNHCSRLWSVLEWLSILCSTRINTANSYRHRLWIYLLFC